MYALFWCRANRKGRIWECHMFRSLAEESWPGQPHVGTHIFTPQTKAFRWCLTTMKGSLLTWWMAWDSRSSSVVNLVTPTGSVIQTWVTHEHCLADIQLQAHSGSRRYFWTSSLSSSLRNTFRCLRGEVFRHEDPSGLYVCLCSGPLANTCKRRGFLRVFFNSPPPLTTSLNDTVKTKKINKPKYNLNKQYKSHLRLTSINNYPL